MKPAMGVAGVVILLASAVRAGLPGLELKPGEFFFRVNGKPAFVFGGNPTGWRPSQFEPLFRSSSKRGEIVARIHLTNGMVPAVEAGEVDEKWAGQWDRVFSMAEAGGIHVLPVFDAWAFWNEKGSGDRQRWALNPYSRTNGGPAQKPAEVLGDTECRRLFLGWVGKLVRRWRDRPNIIGWEAFSELDNITGAQESESVGFIEAAADVIRSADDRRRPVTASLAGVIEWPPLFASAEIDVVQVHPYARPYYDGNLADLIIETVRARLARYGKPVLIGESGLMSGDPRAQTDLKRAHIGLRQASWAAAVSGALSGRMLWWEDGYDRYLGLDFRTPYDDVAVPASRFTAGVDYTGFEPVPVARSSGLRGAVIGNSRTLLGWFRDADCGYPEWNGRTRSGMSVTIEPPGNAAKWNVTFYDTETGKTVKRAKAKREGTRMKIAIPDFECSLAFRVDSR